MKATTTIGVGVIGTGIMGADHIQTLSSAVSGAEVRSVADIDLKRAAAVASGLPGAKAAASAEALIASPEVDAVVVASSDPTHAQYVTACIAARKPVLCEKPLAPTVAECEEILRLEESGGLRLVQVGFNRRFDPGFIELRERLASGVIGTPLLAHCVHRNVSVPSTWTSETTVLSSASHDIDVMPWIFNREIRQVSWMSPIAPVAGKLRDPQVVILELEGGSLIFVELFVTSGYGYEIRCEIVGDKGTIELSSTARVIVRSELKVSQDFPPDWRGRFAEAYRQELQSWANAVSIWRSDGGKKGSDPVGGPDAWDGYRAAVIGRAVLTSMSQRGTIPVESIPLPELYSRCRPSF